MNLTDITWDTEYINQISGKQYNMAYFKKIYCNQIDSFYTDFVDYSMKCILLIFIFKLLNNIIPIHIKINLKLFETKITFLKYFSTFELDNYLFLELAKIIECSLWVRIILLFLLQRGIA